MVQDSRNPEGNTNDGANESVYYNVVFFDSQEVSRSWIAPINLKPYSANKIATRHAVRDERYKNRLEVAYKQADEAEMLPIRDRLAKYSFLNKETPKMLTQISFCRFKNELKRKLGIDFSDDNDSDLDQDRQSNNAGGRSTENGIVIETPKRRRTNDETHVEVSPSHSYSVKPTTRDEIIFEIRNASKDDIITITKRPKFLNVQVQSRN